MFNKYKKEYTDIRVPLDLMTKTLLKMKEEEEKKSYSWKPVIFTALSLAIGCFVFFMIPKDSKEIITDLKVGKTIEQVEVQNGLLYFEKEEEQNRKFGQSNTSTIKTIDKNSALQFSKETIEPLTLKGYQISSKRYYAYLKNDAIQQVEWQFSYENEAQELGIRYISPYNKVAGNSKLFGIEVAIYYGKAEEVQYDAYFNQGKGMYHITATGMEQEAFIKNLTEILKNLNDL